MEADMDEEGFRVFLKRDGRTDGVAQRVIQLTRQFDTFLRTRSQSKGPEAATAGDLPAFVEWVEREPKQSAKTRLWALRNYFEFIKNEEMLRLASALRQERTEQAPFPLKGFSGVEASALELLAEHGIRNTAQMLEAGQAPQKRHSLSERTGILEETILQLVKLSDLARIPGVKDIRAGLYYEAGVDSVEKMAQWEPEALREMIVEFVAQTGFAGVPTQPEEARFTVSYARKLPKTIQY